MLRKPLAGLVLLLAVQDVAWSQFDSIVENPAQPVVVEGFLALHDDGTSFQAFSAFGRRWHTVAPTNSLLVGSGDWVAVFSQPAGPLIGYSARLDATALAPCDPGNLVDSLVSDDVALLISLNLLTGNLEAHGYSGQTNVWQTQVLASATIPLTDRVISRFVIGVIDPMAGVIHGFSARTGAWASTPYSVVNSLRAFGNVLLADIFDVVGIQVASAFSGVVGNWASSPMITGNPPPVVLHHNVAFVMADAGGGGLFNCCGYSAYNGAWLTSGRVRLFGNPFNIHAGENLIVFEQVGVAASGLEAFGARPGTAWAGLAAPVHLGSIGADTALASGGGGSMLLGFSGLRGGGWILEPFVGPGVFGAGPGRFALVEDAAGVVHTFSGAHGSWGAVAATPGAAYQVVDAAGVADLGGLLSGYSARSNVWAGGPLLMAPMVTGSGSVVCAQETAVGPTLGDTHIFDERRDLFVGPFTLGGVSTLHLKRNVVLFEGATQVACFSLQRSAFEIAGGAIPPVLPLAALPQVDENVAAFVDATGRLYAYGSTTQGHNWFAYPNGTEYHRFGGVVRFSIKAAAGTFVHLLYDLSRLATPVFLGGPFSGPLWLPLPIVQMLGLSPGPALHASRPLPAGSGGTQVWTQASRFSPGPSISLTADPDAAWIF